MVGVCGPGVSDRLHGLLWNRDWYVNPQKIQFAFKLLQIEMFSKNNSDDLKTIWVRE